MLKRTTKPLRRRVLIEEGLAKSPKKKHSENTDKWHLCKAGSFSYVYHCGPLPLKELHSTGETIVWRDPGGSWACLPPVYHWVWNHPATGCDMCTTHEKYTKKRETPRKANQNKTTRRAGYKVYAPTPNPSSQRKHSELKEPGEMLNKTKTLTIRSKKKSSNEPVKLERSPTETIVRKTEPYKMLTSHQNKTTRRAGYKKVYAPAPPFPPPKKHSELKEPDEMLSKTKTLTIIAR